MLRYLLYSFNEFYFALFASDLSLQLTGYEILQFIGYKPRHNVGVDGKKWD